MRRYLLDTTPLSAYLQGTPFFLSYSVLRRYATLRRQLRPPHGPGLIGDVDILIAATAVERSLTVVTVSPPTPTSPASLACPFCCSTAAP